MSILEVRIHVGITEIMTKSQIEKLVYLGNNKELFIHTDDSDTQLTYPLEEGTSLPSIWPSWSPDGQWVAYFQPPQDDGIARVCVAQVHGMEVMVLAELTDRMPIYLYWSPTGKHLAVIEQADTLELVVYPLNGQKPIVLDDGAPIFFQWCPDGLAIVAHILHPLNRTSKVQFYSLEDSELDEVISESAGRFCTPVFLQDQLIFAEKMGRFVQVQMYNLQSKEKTTLCTFEGMLAFQVHPIKAQLAIAVNSSEDANQNGVFLFDVSTGDCRKILDAPIQSMFWHPQGDKLLFSEIDLENRLLEWKFWDGQNSQLIGQFIPTREQLFFLHFFEQFSLSHSIVSSVEEAFFFSGYEDLLTRDGGLPKPLIFKGYFREDNPFESLNIGLFPSVHFSNKNL